MSVAARVYAQIEASDAAERALRPARPTRSARVVRSGRKWAVSIDGGGWSTWPTKREALAFVARSLGADLRVVGAAVLS